MVLFGYELKEVVAASERSVVRRGVRLADGTRVVVKLLAREYPTERELKQLEFEYRILRKVAGAGVIRALAFSRSGTEAALILEDFGGKSLVPGTPELDLASFFSVATQAAQALGRLHQRSVVHKDIKPGNLLVNPDTLELKLIDFHVASELSRELRDGAPPELARVEGSLPYMSPEQTGRMNRELDFRTDYYSLGVTLFELLTGSLPFQASDTMAWVHCHISKRPPLATRLRPELPAPLAQLIAKLMAKDPVDRYQSAHGLIADLVACKVQWERGGASEPFELGRHDVSRQFRVPEKLFGREREARALLDWLESAGEEPAKLVLVSGRPGVGKSALVRELERSVVQRKGYFTLAKFERLDHGVPYSALITALRQLVRQLLAESDQKLLHWKSKLEPALAASGRLLLELVPELEQLVGNGAARPGPDATEAKHRLKLAIGELVRAFAQPQHPLVLVLDDLQWMDASTEDVLTNLLGGAEIGHLLVIGAFRDNELDQASPLGTFVAALRHARPQAVHELTLDPLPEAAVAELVAETLHAEAASVAPIARVIFDKTGGNPLFTGELLASLERAGAFRFDSSSGRWSWDPGKVAEASVSDNVAELVVDRLRRVSAETAEVLKLAACIGSRFDFRTLVGIAGLDPTRIASALWEGIEQRIVVPLDGNYRLLHAAPLETDLGELEASFRFQHDRVQQAAYSLVNAGERPRIHRAIGRLLVASGGVQGDDRVFELVNHMNLGQPSAEPAELVQLAQLNLRAARAAKRSGAYAIALRYYERAVELGPATSGSSDSVADFELLRERAECVFLTADFEQALKLLDEVGEHADTKLAKGAALLLKARVIEQQGRLGDAIETARTALGIFDVELPEEPAEIERRIGEGLGRMQSHLAKVDVENLVDLPSLADPEKAMVLELLFGVVAPAIQTYPPLFVLAELMMFDIAIEHGTTALSSKNFVDCGIIQGGLLGNYDVAYRLGQAAFKLLERYPSTALEAAVHFVFASFVSHWRQDYQEGFESLDKCQALGLESGNHHHVAYAYVQRGMRLLYTGHAVTECDAENQRALTALTHARASTAITLTLPWRRMVARLTGSDGDEAAAQAADRDALVTLQQTKNAQALYAFGQVRLITSFLLGDVVAAEEWRRFTEPYLRAANGLFSLPDYHLFHGLLLTSTWSDRSESERAEAMTLIQEAERKLCIWAENCPANFRHKHELLGAELARISGQPFEDVLARYERAIVATGGSFVHLAALAHELEAEFYAQRGHSRIARMLLRKAYRLYAQWGASAVLRSLEHRYPELAGGFERAVATSTYLGSSSTSGGAGSLDTLSVLKATQAISGEVRSDRLFSALMATIIENAGAQRGCLVLRNDIDDRLYVEARANVERDLDDKTGPEPLELCAGCCADIVRYVARTHETVVLDDAALRGPFQGDAYLARHAVKSLLCMPILNQRELVGVLYAENNSASCVFTNERLDVLRVIASQAAISIKNAFLYDSLEENVHARTLELAQKNREIAAMLNGMEQGVFTIDEQLRIQPEYSKHLERILRSASIAGKRCIPLLFRDTTLGADVLNAMEAALRASFGAPAVLAEANFTHVVKEFERHDDDGQTRSFEVDWNVILGAHERVSKVLIAVRDVTMLRHLHETASAKSRELDVVGHILEAGMDQFSSFCASTRALLEANRSTLAASGTQISPTDMEVLFRNVHTIKGNARLLGLRHLVDVVHEAESAYAEMRGERERSADIAAIAAKLEGVEAALAEYERVCSRKLNPGALSHDARLERALGEIESLVAAQRPNGTDVLPRIREALVRLRSVPLAELVRQTSKMVPSLAGELDKSIPEIECHDSGTVLYPDWAKAMRDVLIHAFRNALAHGIEPAAERRLAGKQPHGTIRVVTEQVNGCVRVRLFDDGRGLHLEALRDRSGQHHGSDEQLADAVFVSGISTSERVSQVAGRGVGMDIVRSSVRRRGGDVHIVFTGDAQAGHRPFELVVTLPSDAVMTTEAARVA